MDSYERFYKAYFGWNRKMLRLVGFDVYDKDFSPNFLTFAMWLLGIVFAFIMIYSYVISDSIIRLNITFFFSLLFQAGFKVYNAIYSVKFATMIGFIEHLFELNIKAKSQIRQMLFKRFALYTDLIVKIGCVMYLGATLMFVPYPMYMYIFEDHKELMIPAYFPGIDNSTLSGYCISMVIQATLMFLGSIGMCSCDVFYSLILSNVPILARLIEDEVHQLNEMLEENSNNAWTHQFYTVLMMHQKMTTYISDFNGIFFKICFVQIASCMFSATSLTYVIITENYFPAYTPALFTIASIFIFRMFGNIFMAMNDIAEDAILNVNWYLMGTKEQKMYGHLLIHIQHPCVLTIGGVYPLGWSTSVKLYKSIYYCINLLRSMQ